MLIFSAEMLLRIGVNGLSLKVELVDSLLNLIFEGTSGERYIETCPLSYLSCLDQESIENIIYRVLLTHKRMGTKKDACVEG